MQAIIRQHHPQQVRRGLTRFGTFNQRRQNFLLLLIRNNRAGENLIEFAVRFDHVSESVQFALHLLDLIFGDCDIGNRIGIAPRYCRYTHFVATSRNSSTYLFNIRLLSSGLMSCLIIASAIATDCSATKARNSARAAFIAPSISRAVICFNFSASAAAASRMRSASRSTSFSASARICATSASRRLKRASTSASLRSASAFSSRALSSSLRMETARLSSTLPMPILLRKT